VTHSLSLSGTLKKRNKSTELGFNFHTQMGVNLAIVKLAGKQENSMNKGKET
jgi:hypothetical protein